MTRQQTGLMVLRMWTEEGSSEPLRVDVRQTYDLSRGFRRTLTLVDVELVLAAVRTFLEDGRGTVVAAGDGDGDG